MKILLVSGFLGSGKTSFILKLAHYMSEEMSIPNIVIIENEIGELSIDDKVLSYFPDYQVKRGEKTVFDVTIRHLLTMRAPYKGKGDPWSKVCSSLNWTYASLDFLGGRNGLTDEFRYSTVCIQGSAVAVDCQQFHRQDALVIRLGNASGTVCDKLSGTDGGGRSGDHTDGGHIPFLPETVR